jgi:hypothetical protein
MNREYRSRPYLRSGAVLIPLFLGASCVTSVEGFRPQWTCAASAYDRASGKEQAAKAEEERKQARESAEQLANAETPDASEGQVTEEGAAAAGVAQNACVGSAAEVRACELGFDWNQDVPVEPAHDQDLSNQNDGYVPPEVGPPPPLP